MGKINEPRTMIVSFALFAIVIFLILTDFWGLRIFGAGKIDYEAFGTVGDWFIGIMNLGAVAAALYGTVENRRLNQEQRDASARAEAGRVFSWLSVEYDHTGSRAVAILVHFANHTGIPVYQWRIEMAASTLSLSEKEHGPIAPGDTTIKIADPKVIATGSDRAIGPMKFFFLASNGEQLIRDEVGTLTARVGQLTVREGPSLG